MRKSVLRHAIVGLLIIGAPPQNTRAAEEPVENPERVYSETPATWFEDAWKYASVSQDGKWAIYGNRRGLKLIELVTGRADPNRLHGTLEDVSRAVFIRGNELARLGRRGKEAGWFLPVGPDLQLSTLPRDAVPQWSPDGIYIAWYHASEPEKGLFVNGAGAQEKYENLGGSVTGLAWAADGTVVYIIVTPRGGVSSLVRIHRASGKVETVARELDAAPFFSSLALAPDGKHVYLALAGSGAPRNEARHVPGRQRALNIYEVDLANGARRLKIPSQADDFAPTVAGDYLYWTRNDIKTSVVVLPAAGGTPREIVEDGQLPRWERPGGKRVAFTYGGWRLADWALNLDAGVIDVDAGAKPTGTTRPIITGFHEDFTPAWSPDGKWIAYHSHRSRQPVASYSSEGSSDDVYLRRASSATGDEIRLTDFGWEVGPADWSPDGRRLVFCSWRKGGVPEISIAWVVTIDPDSGKPLGAEKLPLPEPIKGAEEAVWSPNGAEIAIEETTGKDRRTLWIVSANGRKAEKLVEYGSQTYGGLAWTPDGKSILYGGLAGPRMQLFAIPRSGGTPRQISDDKTNLLHPWVSPDGRWVACTRIEQSKGIWRVKLR